MGVGVDDVANRLVAGEPTDFRQNRLGQTLGSGIHEQHALVADLDGDVHGPGIDHPDVALHVQRTDRRCLRRRARGLRTLLRPPRR